MLSQEPTRANCSEFTRHELEESQGLFKPDVRYPAGQGVCDSKVCQHKETESFAREKRKNREREEAAREEAAREKAAKEKPAKEAKKSSELKGKRKKFADMLGKIL